MSSHIDLRESDQTYILENQVSLCFLIIIQLYEQIIMFQKTNVAF
jgi:hypothetical protein